jgi:uncharacterized protein YndB with AHSA1/START domain
MRNVESNIEIAIAPEKVILAFTDAELLRGWWGVERSLVEPKPGGIYTIAWGISDQGIKYVSSGIIKEYDPTGLLHIEKYIYLNPEKNFLGPQELEIRAIAKGKGCDMYLRQGPYPENINTDWEWFYGAVVDAWPMVLQELKKYLEKKFAV